MTWTANPTKEDLIALHGQGYGTPLFDQIGEQTAVFKSSGEKQNKTLPATKMPDWIWTGKSVKAEVYNKMKDKFAEDSLVYLNAIIKLGGKATDHEIKNFFDDADKWPLHIVSARRNYFMNKDFLQRYGNPIIKSYPGYKKPGPKGSPNIIWCVDFTQLYSILKDF